MKRKEITWDEVTEYTSSVTNEEYEYVTAIPRGGLILGVMISYNLGIKYVNIDELIHLPPSKILLIDDISDTGFTMGKRYEEISKLHDVKTSCMISSKHTTFTPDYHLITADPKTWYVFPWEREDSASIPDYLSM